MSIAAFRPIGSRVGRSARIAFRHASALYCTSPRELLPARADGTLIAILGVHSQYRLPGRAVSPVWMQSVRQSSGAAEQPAAGDLSQRLTEDAVEGRVNNDEPNQGAVISEYWGIVPKQFQREDGSPWPWRSFKPSDTYIANVGIDVKRHYPAEKSFVDRLAHQTVQVLRKPVDLFFKNRHVSHALLLETVAAVPGMVGGMLLHLRSLRRFEHSGGWIKTLLDEAENERMHLMTWVEVLRPVWWERMLVLAVQGGFFNAYFLLYLASPRLAHRFVGYLEEEAVCSYTEFLEAIDRGEMANAPAPLIAIDYWRLPMNATIRDVVLVIRADEAHHRDVNHFAADVYKENQELRQAPAPIGYH